MNHPLPRHPNLDHLRDQARDLLSSLRASDPVALTRLAEALPGPIPAEPKLHDAQSAIAREYGFESWSKLRAHVLALRKERDERANRVLELAVHRDMPPMPLLKSGRYGDELKALIEQDPEVGQAGPWAAAATSDVEAVRAFVRLGADPVGGPLDTTPLVYLAHSRLAWPDEAKPRFLEAARLLLDAGADPSAGFLNGDWHESALYGAIRCSAHWALARLLLERGAEPWDGESYYHAVEFADTTPIRMLLDYKPVPPKNNVLEHTLDYTRVEHTRLVLEHGADPNALHAALVRGHDAEVIGLLLEHGADPNSTDEHGLSAYALAVRLGARNAAERLARAGADTRLSDLDRAMQLAHAGDVDGLRALMTEPNLAAQVSSGLHGLAFTRQERPLRTLLAAGADPNAYAGPRTALHEACWRAWLPGIRALLDAGADTSLRDGTYDGVPLGWVAHGSLNTEEGNDADFVTAARWLLEAGSPRISPMGTDAVRAVIAGG